MSLWASPGRQCVCVDDRWNDGMSLTLGFTPPTRVPMINEILTIRAVVTPSDAWWVEKCPGGLALGFIELGHDFVFAIAHFRPLITEEDDVEMFRSIVKEEEEKV